MTTSLAILVRKSFRRLTAMFVLALAGLAAIQPAAAQSGGLGGTGALVRQDQSDCANSNVSGSDPTRVGGTVTITQNAAGATTAAVQITGGTPNTAYNFYWKCHNQLGTVQTDGSGAGSGSFQFQAPAGQALAFDMYPNGAPSGNKYQSVPVTPAYQGQGPLVRQDYSDCGNSSVSGSDPSRIGGTVTITQNAAGATTAAVQLSGASPNTAYNFYWKCHNQLGTVQTDGSGTGSGSFQFQAPAGQALAFDMYPNGAPAGNKYQSVPIAPGAAPVASTQRKSVLDLSATELASLRRGVAQMIAWNSEPANSANFKRSWRYWANMHAYFNTSECYNVSGLNAQGMSGLSAQSASTPDQQSTWCTCEHGTVQFLTWHRMYLYYFEQVLQAAAGDPNLRLPYWDYETNGQMPQAYRDQTYVDGNGNTVPNPLFIPNRRAALNSGASSLSSSTTSTSAAMAQNSYNPFNSQLEGTPHGAVHCAVGVQGCPTGYMGAVPAAGNDPIFYTHHTNIDRLYQCWLQVSPSTRLPSDPGQLNTSFSFIDGTGALVSRKVADMLTTAQLGYSYAAGGGCPPPGQQAVPPPTGPTAAGQIRTFALVPNETRLQRGVTVVPLRLTPQIRSLVATPPSPGSRSMMVISGLTFDEPPQVLYNVYLQAPGGRRALVGTINFFNASSPHAGHAPADQVTLDATDALRSLGSAGADAQLVFEPNSGITGESVEQASTLISARANVRFRSVQIRVTP